MLSVTRFDVLLGDRRGHEGELAGELMAAFAPPDSHDDDEHTPSLDVEALDAAVLDPQWQAQGLGADNPLPGRLASRRLVWSYAAYTRDRWCGHTDRAWLIFADTSPTPRFRIERRSRTYLPGGRRMDRYRTITTCDTVAHLPYILTAQSALADGDGYRPLRPPVPPTRDQLAQVARSGFPGAS